MDDRNWDRKIKKILEREGRSQTPRHSGLSHLVNHVDGFLRHRIEGGDRLRVGFKGALGNDQV